MEYEKANQAVEEMSTPPPQRGDFIRGEMKELTRRYEEWRKTL